MSELPNDQYAHLSEGARGGHDSVQELVDKHGSIGDVIQADPGAIGLLRALGYVSAAGKIVKPIKPRQSTE